MIKAVAELGKATKTFVRVWFGWGTHCHPFSSRSSVKLLPVLCSCVVHNHSAQSLLHDTLGVLADLHETALEQLSSNFVMLCPNELRVVPLERP